MYVDIAYSSIAHIFPKFLMYVYIYMYWRTYACTYIRREPYTYQQQPTSSSSYTESVANKWSNVVRWDNITRQIYLLLLYVFFKYYVVLIVNSIKPAVLARSYVFFSRAILVHIVHKYSMRIRTGRITNYNVSMFCWTYVYDDWRKQLTGMHVEAINDSSCAFAFSCGLSV
jgi:hypothetical protein